MDKLKKTRVLLLIGGFLMMFTQTAIVSNCFSIFVIPVTEDLGLQRGTYQIAQSCIFCGSAIIALLSGKIYSKFGIVNTMRVAGITVCCAYLLQSFASTIPEFYLINFIIGCCNGIGTTIPVALLVGEWFTEHRNFFLGFAMMGSGFGTFLFGNLASSLIESMTWRPAMRTLLIILAAVVLSSVFFLFKEPENYTAAKKGSVKTASQPFFTGKNIPIIAVAFLVSMCSGTFMYSMSPHIEDIGYSHAYASAVYSVGMFTMAGGKLIHGHIIDKHGIRLSNTVMVITAIIGLLGLLFYNGIPFAVMICIGMLFISSFGVVGAPPLAEFMGGKENKAFFLGKLSACISLGYTLAPIAYGAVFDSVHSYVPVYYVCIAILVGAVFLFRILLPKKDKGLTED